MIAAMFNQMKKPFVHVLEPLRIQTPRARSYTLGPPLIPSSVIVFLSLVACASAEPVDPKNPPQGRFVDDWAEIYMAGGKVGFAHSTFARKGDRIHTETTMRLKIGRADQPVEMRVTQSTEESLDGAPLRFTARSEVSMVKTEMTGQIRDGKVAIVNAQFGIEQRQQFDFPQDALMTWGLFRQILLRGFEQGTEYTLSVYAPELRLDDAVSSTTRVGDWETFEHRGELRRGRRVNVTMDTPMGSMEMTTWVDAEGRTLKARIPVPGLGNMELITTDEKTALSDFVPPEVFMQTVINIDRSIDRRAAKQIRYRIRPKDARGAKLHEVPDTDMQRVVRREDGELELIVTRQVHSRSEEPDSAQTSTAGRGQLADSLGPNLMVNTEDPQLIELAKRAAGGETDPYALADRLRRFVSDYVETKSLDVGFATAGEVARTRRGDCTEHGVLLAALGRLNDLPSRVAVGLAYVPFFGQEADIFGYHLWTQFYIDGKWIDVDAALNETVVSPARIALVTSSLTHSGLADLSLPLLSTIGAIDLEIVEIQTDAP